MISIPEFSIYEDFVRDHKEKSPSDIALTKSKVPGFSSTQLAQSIKGYQKIKNKVPSWHANNGLFFPPSLNLEQSSSQLTALYKKGLIQGGHSGIDLTGGLGVDSYFLSEKFQTFTHVDLNKALSQMVKHNFEVLGRTHVNFIADNSMSFLENQDDVFDLIYIDPSRRDADKKRVYRLEDCFPNIIDHWALLKAKGKELLIKNAPLLDLKESMLNIKSPMRIHVVAIRNEVKEVLFHLHKDIDQTRIIASNYSKDNWQQFIFDPEDEKQYFPKLSDAKKYLYIPNAAIMKAGAFNSFALRYQLEKLHPNSHIYTSDELKDNVPARIFRIDHNIGLNKKALKKYLPNHKAHIISRNFPMSADQIRKKVKCISAGDKYIIASTQGQDKPITFLATLL